jgi:hypothetical protein
MKKIIVPEQREEANYYSDFTGQPFGNELHPPVTLKLEFNYGSEYDGSEITLHLSDRDVQSILELISSKLNPDFKNHLKQEFIENDEQYFNAIEARDPVECEYRVSCNNLYKKLLGDEIY